jgi:hypothetical protein
MMLAIKFCKCRGNTADILYEMSVYRYYYYYYHQDISLCIKCSFILSVWFEHGTRVGELVCSLKVLSWTQTRVILFHHLYYHYYQPLQAKYKDYKSTSTTTRNVPLLTTETPRLICVVSGFRLRCVNEIFSLLSRYTA